MRKNRLNLLFRPVDELVFDYSQPVAGHLIIIHTAAAKIIKKREKRQPEIRNSSSCHRFFIRLVPSQYLFFHGSKKIGRLFAGQCNNKLLL